MTYCKNILLSLGKAWIMVLLITIPLLSFTILFPNLMPHFDHIVSQHSLICTAFRLVILSTIYDAWPIFIKKFGQRNHWSREQIDDWIKKRTKVIIWFILFELIVNEKLATTIWHFWK